MNITFEETEIIVVENQVREICVVSVQKDFIRSIPVQLTYMDGTALGKVET